MNYPKVIRDNLERIDQLTDKVGMPVDENVRLTIAALWAHGFVTDASCGGHEDRRTMGPYAWISSRVANELEPQRIAALQAGDEKQEALLGKKVKRANLLERKRLFELLDKFYQGRDVSQFVRLHIVDRGLYKTSLLQCQGVAIIDELKNDDARKGRLQQAQDEFALLTEFLINKLQ